MTQTTFTTWPKPKRFRLPLKLKILVVVMALSAFAGVIGAASSGKAQASTSGPQYVGFATLVVQNYVAGHALDVPMATSLSPTLGRLSAIAAGVVQPASGTNPTNAESQIQPLGFSGYSFLSGSDQTTGKTTFLETDTFLLERSNGSLGAIAVVVDGTTHGPELAALPSLVPVPPQPAQSAPAGATTPVSSLALPISNNIQYRINQWATAYAANDSTALYQVTGDTASATFTGITGYTLVGEPSITAATQDGPKMPKTMVVSVELTLRSTANSNVVTQGAYDLLLTNLNNEYPNVVAWGPPGSGSSLIAYKSES